MKSEKIFVTKSSLPDYDEYCSMIKEIWENVWLTNNGKFHQELEEKVRDYCDVENAVLFTNGHLALENALSSLELKGEVITTPFTFVSTTHAIVRNGLTPVFCDINPEDFTIDVSQIEKLITDKTCAILPVHVYGNICDVEKIEKVAKKHNLKVIYDAAHAFGEKYNGVGVGNFGDISMFSFHATKVFNTIEGGCLTFASKTTKDKSDKLKNFGITDPDNIDYIGGNAKMNEFQAVMGLCNIKNLDSNIEKRKELYMYYLELLKNVDGIQLNKLRDDIQYNYSYFPIVVKDEYSLDREGLIKILNEAGVYPRKYFYPLTNEIACYKDFGFVGDTPIAHDISKRVLTLPLYPDLKKEDVKRICKIISEGGI